MKRTECGIISGMKCKDINGYEGIYKIYESGKVWSYRRKRFLRTPKDRDGYKRVTLCVDKKIKNMTIHRWLYITFVGDIPKTHQINHKDGNKINNNLQNLELVTPKENTQHAWASGLAKKQVGEKTSLAKLTKNKILKIREMHLLGQSQVHIAKHFGIHQTNVHYILKGKTWNHVA